MAGRKIGILIGNGRFNPGSGFSPLRCPAKDVDGLARLLANEMYGGFDIRTVVNGTQREIQLALREVMQSAAGFDDKVLVYYSGHGSPDEDGNLFLAAADSTKRELDATGLALEYVLKRIRSSKSQKIALILDCCFSGAVERLFTKGETADQVRTALPKELSGTGMYVLTASTDTQVAEEKEGDEYSLLTKHIIGGIVDGYADRDDDGIVTMHELTVYVQEAVRLEGRQQPLGFTQRVNGGDLEIARTGRPAMAAKRDDVENAILRARLDFHVPIEIVQRGLASVSREALERGGESARRHLLELHRLISAPKDFVDKLYDLAAAERGGNVVTQVQEETLRPGSGTTKLVQMARKLLDPTWTGRYVVLGIFMAIAIPSAYLALRVNHPSSFETNTAGLAPSPAAANVALPQSTSTQDGNRVAVQMHELDSKTTRQAETSSNSAAPLSTSKGVKNNPFTPNANMMKNGSVSDALDASPLPAPHTRYSFQVVAGSNSFFCPGTYTYQGRGVWLDDRPAANGCSAFSRNYKEVTPYVNETVLYNAGLGLYIRLPVLQVTGATSMAHSATNLSGPWKDLRTVTLDR